MQRLFNRREKAIFFLICGILTLAILFNFLVIPIANKNRELNRQINFSRTKLTKYARLLSRRDYIQDKYRKFISAINLSGSGRDTLLNALSELENLARESNVRIIDIRPQNPKNFSLYKEVPIDLKTEGVMEGYLKFIYALENSLSLLEIKKFQLNARSNSDLLEGVFSISQISPKD